MTVWLAAPATRIATAVAVALLLAPFAAHAQMDSREAISLQNQILQLRRDLQTMQQSGGGAPAYVPPAASRSGGGGNEITAQLLERVSNLEDQVRRLQGRIDELDNARQRQYDDLTKQIGDLNFRLQAAGTGAPRPPGAAPPPTALGAAQAPAAPPPAASPHRTPEMILQEGNAALARRDYPAAEAAAREALANPRNPRAADAQFLLAQALAGQRNWPQAAVAYDDTYKRSPQGTHAQDALLGVAVSLNSLGGKKESCEALDQFKTSFPSPRPDLREQVTAARQRAGCH